jgi:CrcB protein
MLPHGPGRVSARGRSRAALASAVPNQAPSPVDPDVDLHDRVQRRRPAADAAVLGAIAAGGILGSEARYALGLAVPHAPGGWPTATFVINISGCLLIGALMVVLTELTSPHRVVRPFLGVGVLGGWTTFSTAMVEVQQLVRGGHLLVAGGYLVGTAGAALLAAALGAAAVRLVSTGWRRRRRSRRAR